MRKFWNFIRNDAGERILRLEGPIDEESFWGDEVTPKMFREELEAEEGDVTVWVNSPGGNVFAAAEIYTMLCDHKGKITVKIDAIAASAASVVAMAGDRVLMSPVSMLMIHDPMTIAMGNAADMEKAISTLNEVKESIINAYARKSGLSRNKIAKLMSDETWMNAKKAVELGFADEILFTGKEEEPEAEKAEEERDNGKEIKATMQEWQPYSTRIMGQTILNRIGCSAEIPAKSDEESDETKENAQDVESTKAGMNTQLNMFEEDTGEVYQIDAPPETEEATDAEAPAEENPIHTAETTAEEKPPEMPMIGMDGRTEDGSMPFELLKRQLDFLR